MWTSKKIRDLSFVSINDEDMLVVSCDSAGGIGSKKEDVVKVSPQVLGYFTASVALMEVLAVGAKPMVLVNALSVEMDDTGEKVLKGIKNAASQLDNDIIITGSTEENFPTVQTGIGLTVIGVVNKNRWTFPKTFKKDLAVVMGKPKVGEEVLGDSKEVLSIPSLKKIVAKPFVHEVLPVGSKGILHEIKQIAALKDLNYVLDENSSLDLTKSAGPSTCAVISISEKDLCKLKEAVDLPINVVGRFV
ncbi:AIR synthase related protein [Proteinivorax hydrogeniformans]|uniref:AIR synthase related protein n=1 Tax=Proteinivorax hydrogeniformans TaxID=1826727 RepID=A0AAU8HVA8_9FIRM